MNSYEQNKKFFGWISSNGQAKFLNFKKKELFNRAWQFLDWLIEWQIDSVVLLSLLTSSKKIIFKFIKFRTFFLCKILNNPDIFKNQDQLTCCFLANKISLLRSKNWYILFVYNEINLSWLNCSNRQWRYKEI